MIGDRAVEQSESNTALIAIFVSRFEAIQIASMLRGYGINAFIDGEAHAATEYISMALGGHRLTVFRDDHLCASQILQQAGVLEDSRPLRRPHPPLLLFALMIAGSYTALLIGLGLGSAVPPAYALTIPLSVYTVPVEPKGRADYFLIEADD